MNRWTSLDWLITCFLEPASMRIPATMSCDVNSFRLLLSLQPRSLISLILLPASSNFSSLSINFHSLQWSERSLKLWEVWLKINLRGEQGKSLTFSSAIDYTCWKQRLMRYNFRAYFSSFKPVLCFRKFPWYSRIDKFLRKKFRRLCRVAWRASINDGMSDWCYCLKYFYVFLRVYN